MENAVAVLGEAGQSVGVADADAGALQGFDERVAQPLRQLVQRQEAVRRIVALDGAVPPCVAERHAGEAQPVLPNGAEIDEQGAQYLRGGQGAVASRRCKMIEQAAGARAVMRGKHRRKAAHQASETPQQRRAPIDPGERIAIVRLKAAREIVG